MSEVYDLHWRPVRLCSKDKLSHNDRAPNGFASETQTSFEKKHRASR